VGDVLSFNWFDRYHQAIGSDTIKVTGINSNVFTFVHLDPANSCIKENGLLLNAWGIDGKTAEGCEFFCSGLPGAVLTPDSPFNFARYAFNCRSEYAHYSTAELVKYTKISE
jgi:hypothetical protein